MMGEKNYWIRLADRHADGMICVICVNVNLGSGRNPPPPFTKGATEAYSRHDSRATRIE